MAKILIVDDDKSIHMLVQRLLSENGHAVSTAMSRLAALQLFQTQFFDLIITDPRSPSIRGMFFLNEVKKLEPEMPIIILTAYYASTGVPIEIMKEMTPFILTKPFKCYELMDKVKLALNRSKARIRNENAETVAAPSSSQLVRAVSPKRYAEPQPAVSSLGHLTGTLSYCPG